MAGTVKVFLNGERLKVKNFKQYVEMYVTSAQVTAAENSGGAAQAKQMMIHKSTLIGKSHLQFRMASFSKSLLPT